MIHWTEKQTLVKILEKSTVLCLVFDNLEIPSQAMLDVKRFFFSFKNE